MLQSIVFHLHFAHYTAQYTNIGLPQITLHWDGSAFNRWFDRTKYDVRQKKKKKKIHVCHGSFVFAGSVVVIIWRNWKASKSFRIFHESRDNVSDYKENVND